MRGKLTFSGEVAIGELRPRKIRAGRNFTLVEFLLRLLDSGATMIDASRLSGELRWAKVVKAPWGCISAFDCSGEELEGASEGAVLRAMPGSRG
jgi:hypothetical protein